MTDIMKLADEYAEKADAWNRGELNPQVVDKYRAALQSAIEALQGENEQFRLLAKTNAEALGAALAERDALQAKLDALQTQEPVAHFGSAYVNENGVHITTVLGPVAIPQDAKLYAAPNALEPMPHSQIMEIAAKNTYTVEHATRYVTDVVKTVRDIEAIRGITKGTPT